LRDKKRIKRMLKLIQKIWEEYPDLRFGQLIYNTVVTKSGELFRIYYMEDEEVEERLRGVWDEKQK